MPIPRGAERVVTRCETRNQTRASWLDDRTLVIDDAPKGTAARIRAIDVQTGEARDLTTPPPWARGDAEPVVSPDGRQIVFRCTIILGADDLYVLDVATGRERALTDDGWKAAGYVWSNDSRHVFFASNRGGEFGLWSADLLIDGPPRQVALGFGAISLSRMSADRQNRLAVEMSRGPMNLARATPSGRAGSSRRALHRGARWLAAAPTHERWLRKAEPALFALGQSDLLCRARRAPVALDADRCNTRLAAAAGSGR